MKTKTIQEEIGILTNRLKNYTNNKQTLDRFYNDLDKLVKQATLSQRKKMIEEFIEKIDKTYNIYVKDCVFNRSPESVKRMLEYLKQSYEQEIKNGNI